MTRSSGGVGFRHGATMGHECQLRFGYESRDGLDLILREAPHFHRYDAAWSTYEYRGAESLERGFDMPDLTVIISPAGFDVCAYGSGEVTRAICDHLEREVRARFPAVAWEY
ncbi:MAG: hypothetical protein IT377_00880 [Polyangiaceae bacterium]|nr:hypothetical protein [Polyangiaceae bacterium]